VSEGAWRIELFGGLCAQRGDVVVTRFGTRQSAALLALLALHFPRALRREDLAERLWPDEDPGATRERLRTALSAVRRALVGNPPAPPDKNAAEDASAILIADRVEVRLSATLVVTDVGEFEAALRAAARAPTETTVREENLARAITLYKGALLPGFTEEGFVSERERLAEAYLNALGDLADALAQRGDLTGAIEYARRAVGADVLREDSHCRLMRLYARAGRAAEALRQYAELERVLHDQLGTTPGEEARTLAGTIRAGGGATIREPADLPVAAAPSLLPPPLPPPAAAAEETLPTGTVTFLLTDIEGSTRLWEQHPHPMTRALARHDVLVAEIVARHGGSVVKSRGEGDSVFAVFRRATDAVAAAGALQHALLAEPWPDEAVLCVRMALHTGEAELRDNDYFGTTIGRCARLRALAHGGQVLLSQATQNVVRDALPAGARLRDLGQHTLRGLKRPERVFALVWPRDLPAMSPRFTDLLRRWGRKGVLAIGAFFAALVFVVLLVSGRLATPSTDNHAVAGTAVPKPSPQGRLEAEALYAEARSRWNGRTRADLEGSLRDFEGIAKQFPEYAPVHTGIADAYSLLGYYGYCAPDQAFSPAKKAALRALELDPKSAEALASLAWINMIYDWNWNAARVGFLRAINADPEYATAHQWYSFFLMMKKETNESIKEINEAHKLESWSPIISKSVGQRLYHAGRYAEAIKEYDEALDKQPSDSLTHYWRGLVYEQQALLAPASSPQRFDLLKDALQDFEAAVRYAGNDVAPTLRAALGHAQALTGDTAGAGRALEELSSERRAGKYVSPVAEATVYAGLYDQAPDGPQKENFRGRALERLEQAVKGRASDLVLLNIEPRFKSLRDEDAFRAVSKKVNLQ